MLFQVFFDGPRDQRTHRTLKDTTSPWMLLFALLVLLRDTCLWVSGQRACPHFSVLGREVAIEDILAISLFRLK